MKVVIIEDEQPAVLKLESMLQDYDQSSEVIAKLKSVKDSIAWISENSALVDLYFMDVRLQDGLSFDIFKKVSLNKPIIFITAYNEYAIDAFKVNSIDYLLKPLSFGDLSASLQKINSLRDNLPNDEKLKYDELAIMLSCLLLNY